MAQILVHLLEVAGSKLLIVYKKAMLDQLDFILKVFSPEYSKYCLDGMFKEE